MLFLGIFFGWLLRYVSTHDSISRQIITGNNETKKFAQFAAEMQETDALRQASEARTDLELLARLDQGGISDCEALLVLKLGLFYHKWNSKPEGKSMPKHIQEALSTIREAAKHFESVQAVLTYKPGDEEPAAGSAR